MRIKQLTLLVCASILMLMSCSSNDDLTNNSTSDLKTGGTLKITFPTGNSYNYLLVSQYSQQSRFSDRFISLVNEPCSGNGNLYMVSLGSGTIEVTQTCPISLEFRLPPPIQIGKEYCFDSNVGAHFFFGLNSYYSAGETITVKLSAFECPGRITGVEIKYDKAGKMLLKGEFDFISHLN